jgi:hypothetical protein
MRKSAKQHIRNAIKPVSFELCCFIALLLYKPRPRLTILMLLTLPVPFTPGIDSSRSACDRSPS